MTNSLKETESQELLARFDGASLDKFHLQITLATGSGWMWSAFGVTIIGFVMPALRTEWQLSPTQLGFVAGIGMLGMLLGSILAGNVADRFGRRGTLELAIIWIAIFSVISAFSWNYPVLLGFRLLTGLGLGAVLPVASTLVGEYSPAKYRGRISTLVSVFWGVGGSLAAAVGYLLVPTLGWRPALLFGGLAILSIPIIRRYLPESLRYLLGKGQIDQARKIANKIHHEEAAQTNSTQKHIAQAAISSTPLKKAGPGLWSKLYRRRTLCLWVLWFFLNFIFQGIFIWLPSILVASGDSLARSYLFALVINLGQIPGAAIAAFIVDKFGRRNTFLVVLVAYSIFTFLFGFSIHPAAILVWGALLSICNGAAWGMGYPFTTELYPTRIRAAATGWATGFGRTGGIVAPYVVGLLIQWKVSNLALFSLMAAIPLLTTLAILGLRQETSGRVLEEIAS